ncbi:MAG: BamA/TamA family outer membrane protein [Chitinispirillaceae bacterium]|nr:BamA/TamA family outer membrane protein [Chitinispirillaceae bacterium]
MMKSTFPNVLIFIITGILLSAVGISAKEKRWKVDDITFIGNKSYKKSTLISVMELKPSRLFSSTLFTEYKLNSDLNAIERFYNSLGFLDVVAEKNKVFKDSSERNVDIEIVISEGDQYLVQEVQVKNECIDSSDINLLNTKKEKPLLSSALLRDVDKIRELFMKKGKLKVSVTYTLDIDTTRHQVAVQFNINEGPRIIVDSVIVKGNKGLKDRIIERELDFAEGDTLSVNKIRKTEKRLYRTNLLSYVKVESVLSDSVAKISTAQDTSVAATVTVDEIDFFRIEAGAGYSTADKFRGYLVTSYGNLFSIGHKITLTGNLSQRIQNAEIRYGVPWLFLVPLRVDGAGYLANRTDTSTYSGLTRRFEITAGQQAFTTFAYQLRFRWEDFLKNVNANATQSIGLDLAWDTRNDLINPVRGFYNEFQFQVAGLSDKRSREFFKITTDHRVYWKTGKVRWASSLQLGWGEPYGKTDSLPLQERFYGGGSQSIRGFPESGLRHAAGDNLSGNVSVIAHLLEVKIPLFWWVEGALFADAGYIWIRDNEHPDPFSPETVIRDIRWSAGPGIRINTPVAVLRCDVGLKLNKKRREQLAVVHIDIGNSF